MEEESNIEKEPFRSYTLDEDKEEAGAKVLAVRLNKNELTRLQEDMKLIQQPKDSTALKTLAELGSIVIHDEKIALIMATMFKNKRNNKRVGIAEFE